MAKQIIVVPDMGGAEGVEVIDVCVAVGDSLEKEESIVVLETDKASVEVPLPMAGKVADIKVKVGDSVSEGDPLVELESIELESADAGADSPSTDAAANTEAVAEPNVAKESAMPEPMATTETTPPQATHQTADSTVDQRDVYAGPAVRKLAREMGVDLNQVIGTGLRSRITKSNVKEYVKTVLTGRQAPSSLSDNAGIPPIPAVDFSLFGEVDVQEMSSIKKLTAANMSRNWLNIPHVTQFDNADITELEIFRKDLKAEADKRGVKLTLIPFLLKACAAALRTEPTVNVSIDADGMGIVRKHYVHIGVAVDAPAGLMVPVLRDVDNKGLWQLAAEFGEITQKARDGKLTPKDMQGGCFTISSLGAMGGTGFTPIVNAPEVAILGVSKAAMQPVWNGSEFVPRQLLPLALSYDHRAINGSDAGRFFTYLTTVIGDIRRLLL